MPHCLCLLFEDASLAGPPQQPAGPLLGSDAKSQRPEAITSASTAPYSQATRRIGGPLFVEPDVLHPPAVEDAVDHQSEPLDMRLPARPIATVEDDRPGIILR